MSKQAFEGNGIKVSYSTENFFTAKDLEAISIEKFDMDNLLLIIKKLKDELLNGTEISIDLQEVGIKSKTVADFVVNIIQVKMGFNARTESWNQHGQSGTSLRIKKRVTRS